MVDELGAAMTNKIIMTDGTRTETLFRVKGINPYTDETPGVWSPDIADANKQARNLRLIPSVFAGIAARMQAMADLPFTIYSLDRDVPKDSSDNYKNVIGFLPNPIRFFGLSEAALISSGRAYWFKEQGARTGGIKNLRYWLPSSVTLDANKAKNNVIEFRRLGTTELFPAESVFYSWLYDEGVELGPPTVWPLESAMIAAEANGAISTWVRDYMRRGAIKAMLLAVDGMPPPGEVEKIENWFNRFMTGVRGLTWKVFNASNVKPTIVGDGLEALKDLTISKELRYEIHTALGTRHLLEDENFATASARERQFYTQVIVPDARLLQNNFNEQLAHSLGYHLEFEPQRLEVFQTDEAERAGSLAQLFGVFKESLSAGKAMTLAMDILGYDISKEQQKLIDAGLAEKQEARESAPPAPVQEQPQAEELEPPNKAIVELDKWRAKSEKAGKIVTWHAVDLPDEIVKAITAETTTWEMARAELAGRPKSIADAALFHLKGLELAVQYAESRNGNHRESALPAG